MGLGLEKFKVQDLEHSSGKEISEKKVTSRRGEASGPKLLEQSRQFPPRCFALLLLRHWCACGS